MSFKEENFSNIQNGFQIQFKTKFLAMKGSYFMKTTEGFYKNCFLALRNEELYLYNDFNIQLEDRKLLHMIVLTPGVFVERLPPISLDTNLKEILNLTKLFPIELYVGGICGNVGI